jgi:septum formation topological specificity factor MinE
MSKQVEPYIEQGRIALQQGKSLREVREAMAAPYQADVARTEALPFPSVPAPVEITEDVAEALKRLPEVFMVVQPTERRTLTDEEKIAVYEERDVLKHILVLLETRDEHLKTIIRHHMDVDAEERNIAVQKATVDPGTGQVIVEATDRTTDGHYILCGPGNPERTHIPGTNQDWSREYRKGTVTSDESVLDQMHEEGEIDRDVYLAMTRQRRVFDENKAQQAALEKPDLRDEILRVIAKMTRQGKPSVSLFTRKAR